MIIDGTTAAWSRSLARVSIADIRGERDGDEIGGKFRIVWILIVSSPITFLMSLMTVLGSLPGSSRQSISAYAVSEITLVFWLADSTVGVMVSRACAVWLGSERNFFRNAGSLRALARSSWSLGLCSRWAIE